MDGWMDEKLSNSILFNFLLKNGIWKILFPCKVCILGKMLMQRGMYNTEDCIDFASSTSFYSSYFFLSFPQKKRRSKHSIELSSSSSQEANHASSSKRQIAKLDLLYTRKLPLFAANYCAEMANKLSFTHSTLSATYKTLHRLLITRPGVTWQGTRSESEEKTSTKCYYVKILNSIILLLWLPTLPMLLIHKSV
jgi:hypothetical protein